METIKKTSEMKKSKTSWFKRLGWTGITLCGLCCALPVVGTAIGVTSLAAFSFYLEKIGILVMVVAIFFFLYGWYIKRKKANSCAESCDVNCGCNETVEEK